MAIASGKMKTLGHAKPSKSEQDNSETTTMDRIAQANLESGVFSHLKEGDINEMHDGRDQDATSDWQPPQDIFSENEPNQGGDAFAINGRDSIVATMDRIAVANLESGVFKYLQEGDIRVPEQNRVLDSIQEKRNAVRDRNRLWHTRDIPFVFDSSRKFSCLLGSSGSMLVNI